jgi:hypothetical protein
MLLENSRKRSRITDLWHEIIVVIFLFFEKISGSVASTTHLLSVVCRESKKQLAMRFFFLRAKCDVLAPICEQNGQAGVEKLKR